MEIVTVRLDPDEVETIDAEVDQRGFSNRAEYLRWIIRHRSEIDSDESLSDELSELRERVERLESDLDT